MTSIQIRDVPEDLHTELVQQAKERGLSLQKYLLDILQDSTRVNTRFQNQQRFLDQMVALPSLEKPLTTEEVVELVHAGRRERDERINEWHENARKSNS